MDASPILKIEKLNLGIGTKPILRDIDLTVGAGSVHAIVGESGSGKSMTALATMQLLPNGAKASGAIRFQGQNLLELTEPEMC
ncbi:MAG: ATP-binding cassette domain-containing protein, partial [Pseudomonadota bacterium]